MELLLISNDQLKVTLSAADMARFELRPEELDYGNTETRSAFWNILDRAKHETGFDAATDRVLVQVYPSVSGGCELFVTKLHEKKQQSKSLVPKSRRVCLRAWRMESMDELLAACGSIAEDENILESSAYRMDDGGYVLFLTGRPNENTGLFLCESYTCLREYGKPLDAAKAMLLMPEHGKLLIDRAAVRVLGALA